MFWVCTDPNSVTCYLKEPWSCCWTDVGKQFGIHVCLSRGVIGILDLQWKWRGRDEAGQRHHLWIQWHLVCPCSPWASGWWEVPESSGLPLLHSPNSGYPQGGHRCHSHNLDVYGSCSLSHSLPEWKCLSGCVILNVLTQFYFWNYCLPVANSSLLCLSELSLWLLIILWQVPLVALTVLEKGNSVLYVLSNDHSWKFLLHVANKI